MAVKQDTKSLSLIATLNFTCAIKSNAQIMTEDILNFQKCFVKLEFTDLRSMPLSSTSQLTKLNI